MDRTYPYTRRIARRAQSRRAFAAFALLGLAGCGLAVALAFGPDPIAAAIKEQAQQTASIAPASVHGKPAARPVYRYSVVPGGVATQPELARIVRSDKVVATHYASFDVSRAQVVTVGKPRAVHVSYRKGDKVYWTAKKVMLREGETLLSDGKNEMRTRCANRVSDVAQFPVEAHAPSVAVLDAVEGDEGSLQNASAAMDDESGLPALGQQPQLPVLTYASAGDASTAAARPGLAPAPMPSFGRGFAPVPLTPLTPLPALTPGAAVPTQDTPADAGMASAPALVVATDVIASVDAPAGASPLPSPAQVSIEVPLAPSKPAAAEPELAPTPRPGSAAPPMLVTLGDDQSSPADVPEPGSTWLFALALGTMLLLRKKR